MGYGGCSHSGHGGLGAHAVELEPFWIDRTEVTNGQYTACVAADACTPPREGSFTHSVYYGDETYADYPILYARWTQAQAYCEWAGARMPAEAEWEYAARGEAGLQFPWGDEFDGTRLNYCDANCLLGHADARYDDDHFDTAPVGSYPEGASWCGALDMAGNVWEWVADPYRPYPDESGDPGEDLQLHMVVRGGSWATDPSVTRTAYRGWFETDVRFFYAGFRCVRDLE